MTASNNNVLPLWADSIDRRSARLRAASCNLMFAVDSIICQLTSGYDVTATDERDAVLHSHSRNLIAAGVSGLAWRQAVQARMHGYDPRPTGEPLAVIDATRACLAPLAAADADADVAVLGVFKNQPAGLAVWPTCGLFVASTIVVFDEIRTRARYSRPASSQFSLFPLDADTRTACGDVGVLEFASRLARDDAGMLSNPLNAIRAAAALHQAS